jgi:hypothetical protein
MHILIVEDEVGIVQFLQQGFRGRISSYQRFWWVKDSNLKKASFLTFRLDVAKMTEICVKLFENKYWHTNTLFDG